MFDIFIFNFWTNVKRGTNDNMCRAVLISEVIINRCIDNNFPINTSKLQKILYYMQKEHLKKYDSSVFDEKILAWECGPAIEEVYSHFKFGRLCFKEKVKERIVLLDSHDSVLGQALKEYGAMQPYQVSDESKKETAWIKIWNNGEGKDKEIPLDEIKISTNGDIE